MYSKKRGKAMVAQSLRLTATENLLLRKAADLEGRSINTWATRHLIALAKHQIAAAQPQPDKPESENAIG